MREPYVIDLVPFDKLDVRYKNDYGKIWYCHVKGYPEICVAGSIGSRKHAQAVCKLQNESHGFGK